MQTRDCTNVCLGKLRLHADPGRGYPCVPHGQRRTAADWNPTTPPSELRGAYVEAAPPGGRGVRCRPASPARQLFLTGTEALDVLPAALPKGADDTLCSKNRLVFGTVESGFKLWPERWTGARWRKGWGSVLRNCTFPKCLRRATEGFSAVR